MVIGSGGREHAIIKKIKENKNVEMIYALPGNAGMKKDAECVNISVMDFDSIIAFAIKNKIDFAVVAPDNPLVEGLVDRLEEAGIASFGPNKRAAIIEGSKVFSKNLMKKYNIPTAEYVTFKDIISAKDYIASQDFPLVIKADGLAFGKGVIIANNQSEANSAIDVIMSDKLFGKSGNQIVIEEYLQGIEVSVLAFTDGKTIIPMVSSMDHKRALDNDEGLNTGGMGVIAPNPFYTKEIADEAMKNIFIPTINAMNEEDRRFKGCLYFGLIITDNGIKVIEYNCRFGDPEAQAVLPLLKSDLLDIMLKVSNEKLSEANIEFEQACTCCVIMASKGYPESYLTGFEISVPDDLLEYTYMAGVAENDCGNPVSASGRVLGVTMKADTLKEAVYKAYQGINLIDFENKYYRKDIGKKAVLKEEGV